MIDAREMEVLAAAARLELTEEEGKIYAERLNGLLAHIEKFLDMDLTEVEPFTFVHSINNVLRKDEIEPGFDQETALANAPVTQDGQFLVPRII